MGILHRDLACRNVLVDRNKVLKITDFGLSHECSNLEICSDHQVPLKWMPLEYIGRSEFAFPSDVWSFGIVLWEIATLGKYYCFVVFLFQNICSYYIYIE